MRNNRTAGHSYETDIAKQLRDIGFEHVVTSRSENRSRDNAKIDFVNRNEFKHGRLEYNIQAKSMTDHDTVSGKAEKVNYKKLLNEIEIEEGIVNVVFHKHTLKKPGGTNFITQGEYAFLHKRDFMQIIKDLRASKDKLKKYETGTD